MHWPQIVILVFQILGFLMMTSASIKKSDPKDFITAVISAAISQWLLIMGGWYK